MRTIAITIILTMTTLAGCTSTPASTTSCHAAVDAIFPASARGRAHQIVQRESGGNPRAQNRRSTAAGCFQLLSMHADLFRYGWGTRYDAAENVLAAFKLYAGSGWIPWRL